MNCITNVSYSNIPNSFQSHAHNEHEIIFLKSGTIYLQTNSGQICIDKPSVISIGILAEHAVISENKYERYFITLNPKKLPPDCERIFTFFLAQFQIIDVSEIAEKINLLFEMMADEFKSEAVNADEGCIPILQSLLLLIYRRYPGYFPNNTDSITQTVRHVQAELQKNLDCEISMKNLAETFHVSQCHLSHSFRRITGYSMIQYRLLYKIRVSCELLENSDLSISQICEQIGFSDMSNYSRYFKKNIGLTPSEFRKKSGKPSK